MTTYPIDCNPPDESPEKRELEILRGKLFQLARNWESVAAKVKQDAKAEAEYERTISCEEAGIIEDCAKTLRGVVDGKLDPDLMRDDGTYAGDGS